MRTVKNYELVLTEQEDRLLLTYDWEELPYTPRSVSEAVCDFVRCEFRITFEDRERLEEVSFVNLPEPLLDLVKKFSKVTVVSFSDKVEVFFEVSLEHKFA